MAHARTTSFASADRTVPAETATIRRRIRRALPAEALKPRRVRALTVLALVAAIAALTVALVAAPLPGAAALLLSLVCGCLYGSLFFVGHEVGHGAVVKSRAAQWALMWPAFSIFVLSPTLWRVWHNKVHHGHTNRAEYDPDNFGFPSSFETCRSVRLVAALTPGSGRLGSLLYLPIWFTVHTQVVLWRQSLRCRRAQAGTEPASVHERLGLEALPAADARARRAVPADSAARLAARDSRRNRGCRLRHPLLQALGIAGALRRPLSRAAPLESASHGVRHPPVPRSARRAGGSGERPQDDRC